MDDANAQTLEEEHAAAATASITGHAGLRNRNRRAKTEPRVGFAASVEFNAKTDADGRSSMQKISSCRTMNTLNTKTNYHFVSPGRADDETDEEETGEEEEDGGGDPTEGGGARKQGCCTKVSDTTITIS